MLSTTIWSAIQYLNTNYLRDRYMIQPNMNSTQHLTPDVSDPSSHLETIVFGVLATLLALAAAVVAAVQAYQVRSSKARPSDTETGRPDQSSSGSAHQLSVVNTPLQQVAGSDASR